MFGLTPWDAKLPPDFVNDKGVKWWADKDLTRYARQKLGGDATVWYIEETNGLHTRLLTEKGEIINDDQTYEGMACHIDILSIARKP